MAFAEFGAYGFGYRIGRDRRRGLRPVRAAAVRAGARDSIGRHGVHFLDLFAGWLGEGKVVAAQASCRAGTTIEDQVQCTMRYGGDVHVNFYHSFHQAGRMDRQELRRVFEQGDLLLHGSGPTYARLHSIADEAATREPILEPQQDFENEGFVSKVVFPTGVVEEDERLLIYYGASDKYCAMAEVSRRDVMRALE